MYMPSYKLNNSYTVYVNYVYLNDCIKASKKLASKKAEAVSMKVTQAKANTSVSPLATNTRLQHKVFGIGKVLSTQNGIMSVEFRNKVARFIYPDAIQQGYLAPVAH